jgi:hypothetical protein
VRRGYISADVATRRGLDAVGPYDHAGHDIVAVLEAQPHAGWLVGQAGQPVIQLDTFRWHRPGKQTLKGRAMECQEWCANLEPVPLAYRLGPQEPAILPGADLKSRRHIGDLRQIDAETLQQARRVTADRDPGPDFPELGILFENLHGHRLLQEADGQCQATDAATDDGDVTLVDHVCCPLDICPSPASCPVRVPGGLPQAYR